MTKNFARDYYLKHPPTLGFLDPPLQTPPSAREKGSGVHGHNPCIEGKEFEHSNQIAALSKSCNYLPQEFGRTNHNAGLFLLSESPTLVF